MMYSTVTTMANITNPFMFTFASCYPILLIFLFLVLKIKGGIVLTVQIVLFSPIMCHQTIISMDAADLYLLMQYRNMVQSNNLLAT